ncbi:MAG: hypothetical protein AAFW46_07910 [Pseudomonadota bacterium]
MFRALGYVFLFAACVAALLDWWFSQQDGEGFRLHPLGEMWFRLHQESWVLLQPAVERHLHPDLWFGFLEPIFQTPAIAVLGGLGVLFWIISSAASRRSAPY